MRLKAIIIPAAVAALAVVIWVLAQGINENVHPPLRYPTVVTPYEPERIIRMTLHEYVNGSDVEHKTTGRYVTFGLPMKYLDSTQIFPGQVPVGFSIEAGWERQSDESFGPVNKHDERGVIPRDIFDDQVNARVSAFRISHLHKYNKDFIEARESGAPFNGYKPGSAILDGTYWLGETYCGFDVFERYSPRNWHIESGNFDTPPPPEMDPPFDHARYFGLPDGEGAYQLAVECRDTATPRLYCNADAAFNEYITLTVLFQHTRLCDARSLVDANLKLLRAAVVDASAGP